MDTGRYHHEVWANALVMDSSLEMPWRESLVDARSSALEAAKLTQQMLEYLGSIAGAHRAVDVGQLIRERSGTLRSILPAGAHLDLEVWPDLPQVVGDAEIIASALRILVKNAAEALVDDKGVVGIRAGWQREPPATPTASYLPDGPLESGLVTVTVEDNGTGIAPDIEEKIFDPFFSTRFLGRGLGLSSLLGMLRTHDSAVRVDTALGRGTAFTILLPAMSSGESARPLA